jgi:hypothetical protein
MSFLCREFLFYKCCFKGNIVQVIIYQSFITIAFFHVHKTILWNDRRSFFNIQIKNIYMLFKIAVFSKIQKFIFRFYFFIQSDIGHTQPCLILQLMTLVCPGQNTRTGCFTIKE